jgi:hypothetical protein
MKYSYALLFFLLITPFAQGQGTLPPTFFEGKSIILVSNDPGAKPAITWQALADSIHPYLVRAGGDPVGYFELEQVALSTALQAVYAKAFLERQIQNVVLITRQKEQVSKWENFQGKGKSLKTRPFLEFLRRIGKLPRSSLLGLELQFLLKIC